MVGLGALARTWVWFPVLAWHSQPSVVTPVPEDPATSDFCEHQAYMWYTCIHAGRILTHIE